MNKKVYIIILNYNGWQDTIECLESVLKSNYKNYQIIVVDNQSPNNSMDYLIKWVKGELCLWLPYTNLLKYLSFPLKKKPLDYILYSKKEAINGGDKEKENKLKNPIIFIQAGENRGFAAGNNIGIKYALKKDDFEYIWLLNNDTVIEKNALEKLIYTANKTSGKFFGTTLFYYHKPLVFQAVGGGNLNNLFGIPKILGKNFNKNHIKKLTIKELDFITGASFFMSKDIILKVGLLNENYFMYWEDTDWSLRMIKKGYRPDVVIDSIVYHKESNSIGFKSFKQQELDMQNTLNFYFLHRPLFLFFIILFKPLYNILSRLKSHHYQILQSLLTDLKIIKNFLIKKIKEK